MKLSGRTFKKLEFFFFSPRPVVKDLYVYKYGNLIIFRTIYFKCIQ